ncbi:hypothetical protein B1B04_20985 [Lysinibacillus sp. KCTC 33748]|uniref:hypothetical protein n=1 Tax=unclassified Lysinibacillus TaxID=2636778 RepID=UPI0009A65CA2|nr:MULTISPECIES: hypothetical protein [unclassified Lysinibacillus]OXS68418.1 hypothetical protein B1B04_20985 [Lysinibacillus sp. KCTC 33748]SKC11381.1 hypothetical protein SAMN06295926_12452 [Lysinibacillus sp. AC-3]
MSKVTLSDDINSYNSKPLIRAKVKEFFPEFSAKIFELANEAEVIDSKKFEALSGFKSDFYTEYCSQLKGFFDSSASTFGKRPVKNMFLTYKGTNYIFTKQGIAEKAPITISLYSGEIPVKETLHDVEKACLKYAFNNN